MSIESVMPSNHLILCRPLLLLPSIFPSIRVFSNELTLCITWPKYWSFSLSISPSNKYWGFLSFRIDWFDLLAVQGTLKSLLQHQHSKASVLQHLALFIVQLSPLRETVKKLRYGASLVVQWLRICLQMQGTQVPPLVREDPTCHGATKPMRFTTTEPSGLQPMLCNKRSHCNEKPSHHS